MYLNHRAVLQCSHLGRVILSLPPVRSFNIMGSPAITDTDLMQAVIVGCTQGSPVTKPCTRIVGIIMGRGLQIKVDGQIPILDSLQAVTDGVPPGFVSALYNGGSNATPAPVSVQSLSLLKAAIAGLPFCRICGCSSPANNSPVQGAAGRMDDRKIDPKRGNALSTPSTRKQQLIDAQDAARNNPTLQASPSGITHCNQATALIARDVGAPTSPLVDSNGDPLLANTQARNLAKSSDYAEVPPGSAQRIANQGGFVIAAYENPSGHGHVATVRPEGVQSDDAVGRTGPLLNDIGAFDRIDHQSAAFRKSAIVRYYSPK